MDNLNAKLAAEFLGEDPSSVETRHGVSNKIQMVLDKLKQKHLLPQKTTPAVFLAGLSFVLLFSGVLAAVSLSSMNQDIRQRAATNCSVTCPDGVQFTDPNPYTFANCSDWANEACSGHNIANGGGSTTQQANNDNQANTNSNTNTNSQVAGGDVVSENDNGSCPSGYSKHYCGDCLWERCANTGSYCNDLIRNNCKDSEGNAVKPCYEYTPSRCAGGCVPDAKGFACNDKTKSTCNTDGTYVTVETDSEYCGGGGQGVSNLTDQAAAGTGGTANSADAKTCPTGTTKNGDICTCNNIGKGVALGASQATADSVCGSSNITANGDNACAADGHCLTLTNNICCSSGTGTSDYDTSCPVTNARCPRNGVAGLCVTDGECLTTTKNTCCSSGTDKSNYDESCPVTSARCPVNDYPGEICACKCSDNRSDNFQSKAACSAFCGAVEVKSFGCYPSEDGICPTGYDDFPPICPTGNVDTKIGTNGTTTCYLCLDADACPTGSTLTAQGSCRCLNDLNNFIPIRSADSSACGTTKTNDAAENKAENKEEAVKASKPEDLPEEVALNEHGMNIIDDNNPFTWQVTQADGENDKYLYRFYCPEGLGVVNGVPGVCASNEEYLGTVDAGAKVNFSAFMTKGCGAYQFDVEPVQQSAIGAAGAVTFEFEPCKDEAAAVAVVTDGDVIVFRDGQPGSVGVNLSDEIMNDQFAYLVENKEKTQQYLEELGKQAAEERAARDQQFADAFANLTERTAEETPEIPAANADATQAESTSFLVKLVEAVTTAPQNIIKNILSRIFDSQVEENIPTEPVTFTTYRTTDWVNPETGEIVKNKPYDFSMDIDLNKKTITRKFNPEGWVLPKNKVTNNQDGTYTFDMSDGWIDGNYCKQVDGVQKCVDGNMGFNPDGELFFRDYGHIEIFKNSVSSLEVTSLGGTDNECRKQELDDKYILDFPTLDESLGNPNIVECYLRIKYSEN